MDFLDFMNLFPVNMPGHASRERSVAENVTGAVGLGVAPIADFIIVLSADLWEQSTIALLLLPAAFTLAILLLCRRLQVSTAWTVIVTLSCAGMCFVASGTAFLMGVFFSIFSAF
jgi:hypothetical protein